MKRRRKIKVLILIGGVCVCALLSLLVACPPTDGYYECSGLAPMDGSSFYFCLEDGAIYGVRDRPDYQNNYGQADARNMWTSYENIGWRRIEVRYQTIGGKTKRVTGDVGWSGICWDDGSFVGFFAGSKSSTERIFSPARIRKLRSIE